MKFKEHSILTFSIRKNDSNSLLHVIANKYPTWISWKGYSCNWCGFREFSLLFIL